MFFVLKFELILIIGSNKVLSEGARKVYRGRRVGQGWSKGFCKRLEQAIDGCLRILSRLIPARE
jgi:hypothetical protein